MSCICFSLGDVITYISVRIEHGQTKETRRFSDISLVMCSSFWAKVPVCCCDIGSGVYRNIIYIIRAVVHITLLSEDEVV